MGKDPGLILKQQIAKAKHRVETIDSAENDTILTRMYKENRSYCMLYKDVVKAFLAEGYTDAKADRYIAKWADYDLVWTGYVEGYHLVGFWEVD